MATAAKQSLSRAEQMEEILSVTNRTRATTEQKQAAKETDSRFASIETNPFFQVVFNENTDPDTKQEELAKILTFSGTKEEARVNIAAYNLFKEYLQSVREEMAVDTIKMSDPKNFAVLRDTYEAMNGGLIDFENKIAPLVEILDALEQLRVNGETMDVFREIKNDEERNAAIAARKAEIATLYNDVKNKIDQIESEEIRLESDKGWFGMEKKGNKDRLSQIALEKRKELERLAEIDNKNREIDSEANTVTESSSKNIDAKRKLREMLDLSAEGHETRGNELIESAVSFVAQSKEKIGTIRDHLSHMEGQIINLHDSSDNMTMVFALLDGGTKKAEENNIKIREELTAAKEGESTVERLTRETKKRDLDEHISVLENSAQDTTATIADLTSQSIRIKDMKDANQGQIQMAREMHARGVAGVADRISTVIQAVGQAALSESSQMAAHTLDTMRQNTDMLAQKSSLQVAMGIQDRNASLEKAIENLAQYGRVHEEATKITKAGLADMGSLINKMESTAQEVASNVSKSYALAADAVSGSTTEDAPKSSGGKTAGSVKSPFNR